ncbi:hypothetical protein BC937DRAFT_92553 [Endogone sp. FLAS-F59071]|nr:hypothetical protein BC937DRAFT_92553 [Endogone sp. FLAS-F59071]|eukprot:RUS15356.1 hypothetical protein BC937DRAFT_92553 [Endogone sp. FLAS-F59071]
MAVPKPGDSEDYKHEIIMELHPSVTVEETNKLLPDDRLYIVPAYKCTDYLQAPNIYHVETSATDLKNEDFVKAAAEC